MNSKRGITIVLTGLILLSIGIFAYWQSKQPLKAPKDTDVYDVKKVVDGDTIEIERFGRREEVRLIGMDTPEVVDPRKPVQCFGREASAKAHEILENKQVRLEFDSLTGDRDKYQRLLAYLWEPDGTLYNQYMIAQGYAHEYTYQSQAYKYQLQFKRSQADAKAGQLGFWSPTTCNGNTTQAAN